MVGKKATKAIINSYVKQDKNEASKRSLEIFDETQYSTRSFHPNPHGKEYMILVSDC